ncbi:DUF2946 family protein [Granulicella arctica]|uniref:DUF2946 domain-containing protein n=1 Tax=Granulicella arctica TaxID=940613 RepID=A0A7Y9PGC2_9BACT|nr:DUF2946 family protein [Granulicella arctica]NYF79185.1 hypothetical protein [Granulicella arctica]
MLGVLLLIVMSTVQVCHTHDPLLQQSNLHHGTPRPNQNQSPTPTPDHCPLCMALHAAMPATAQSAPEPVLLVQTLNSPAADARRIVPWHFHLAIRPPPVDAPRA